jgi:hypothetical protein
MRTSRIKVFCALFLPCFLIFCGAFLVYEGRSLTEDTGGFLRWAGSLGAVDSNPLRVVLKETESELLLTSRLIGELRERASEELRTALLDALVKTNKHVTVALFLDSEGEILSIASRRSVLPSEQAVHKSMAPWAASGKEKSLVYSSFYLSGTSRSPRLALSVPLVDRENIHFGYLTAEIQLKILDKVVEDFQERTGDAVVLLDPAGTPLVPEAIRKQDREVDLVAELFRQGKKSGKVKAKGNEPWDEVFMRGERKAKVVFYPLGSFGWMGAVFSPEPASGFLSSRRMFLIGIVALLLLSLAGTLFFERFTRSSACDDSAPTKPPESPHRTSSLTIH